MAWDAIFLEKEKIVHVVFSGTISDIEFQEAIAGSLLLAEKNGTKQFLTDCTEMESGASVLKAIELAKKLSGMDEFWEIKEAIIFSKHERAVKDLEVYEAVTNNRGMNIKIFHDRESALRWLLQ